MIDRSDFPTSDQSIPIGEWWVDDDGGWRNGAYLSLIAGGDSDDARRDAECGALFHLGMAHVCLASNRILVRWSVQHVMPDTLRAVNEFLTNLLAPPRIVMEYYFGAWERLHFTEPEAARACLESAAAYRDAIPIPKPHVRQVALEEPDASVPAIRTALVAWERSRGRFSLNRENAFSRFNQRVLAFAQNRREDDLVYAHLGSQAALTRFKGRAWAEAVRGQACGQGVERDPYSDVLTGPYGEVLRTQMPRLDHVRVRITRHTDTAEWVTYQRLLMPAEDEAGRPVVLCMAARTPLVRIPSQAKTA